MIYKTRYYGIWIIEENGHWWIQDTNGNDHYCGINGYQDEDIEMFLPTN